MFTLVLAHANNFQDTCYRKQESPKSDFNWAAKCDFFMGKEWLYTFRPPHNLVVDHSVT